MDKVQTLKQWHQQRAIENYPEIKPIVYEKKRVNKLSDDNREKIKEAILQGATNKSLAIDYGVSINTIWHIRHKLR